MNKNTNKMDINIPEEILMLVPWYATGKLSDEDNAFFEDALVDYPSLQKHLKDELQMIETISSDQSLLNKSAIAPTEERLKAVFNMIDTGEQQQNHSDATSHKVSILDQIKDIVSSFFSTDKDRPQFARVASAAVVVVSLAILTAFVAPIFTEKENFVPASATTSQKAEQTVLSSSVASTVLLVGFNGSSVDLGNNKVLVGKLSSIKSVPNKDNMYQISFNKSLTSTEVKETIEALLLQKELIWFAGEEY